TLGTLRRWSWVAFPVGRTDWLEEVTLGNQVAFIVDSDGQLRKWVRSRTEDDLHFLCQVISGLVARAQQVVRVLFIQRNRATDVGANLRIRHYAVDVPVFALRADIHVFRIETHQQHDGFSLLVQLVFFKIEQAVWNHVNGRSNRDVSCLDWSGGDVAN